MIRTDREYQEALDRLERDRDVIKRQRARLEELKLGHADVQRALEPTLAFHEQLVEEVDAYDRMRRGDIDSVWSLAEIGRMLIGLRIAAGLTQRELAKRLEVAESQVSRDERNDYHGISVDRAAVVIQAIGGSVEVRAQPPERSKSRDFAPA